MRQSKPKPAVGAQLAVSRRLQDIFLHTPLPSSLEAERAVLGCYLHYNDLLDLGDKEEWFYHAGSRVLFQEMKAMRASGLPVDYILLCKWLADRGKMEEIGGNGVLADILDYVPAPTHYKHYLNILKECTLARVAVQGGVTILEMAYHHDRKEIATTAATQLALIEQAARGAEPSSSWADEVSSFEQDWNERYQGKKRSAIPSRWSEWDAAFGGILPQYHIIKGKTSRGKTTLALNILKTVAVDRKEPCIWFPYEMQKDTLIKRLIADIASIDSRVLFAPDVFRPTQEEMRKITRAMSDLSAAPIKLVKEREMGVQFLRAQCLAFQKQGGLSLVGIDYLQKVSHPEWAGRNDNSSDRIAYNSDQCFKLQQELNCAMFVISSTNQDGGVLGSQGGDYDTDIAIEVDLGKLTIKKHRHGKVPPAPIELRFNPQSVRFESLMP